MVYNNLSEKSGITTLYCSAMKRFLTPVFIMLCLFSYAQSITVLTTKSGISLRGLSVVNDSVLWASGNKGNIARSLDGGRTFEWTTVAGYEARDFRDVEAFDRNTAVIMAVDAPAVILKTRDGGRTWKNVFTDTAKGMFLDAMDFEGKYGVVVGDPIGNHMFTAYTETAGDSWLKAKDYTRLDSGEAFFASSGTNIKLLPVRRNLFRHAVVSGGTKAEFIGGRKVKLALVQGKESQGANSVAVDAPTKRIVVVGGDFMNDKDTAGNCVLSADGGRNWTRPQTAPHGYRSCVVFVDGKRLVACGTSGVDVSGDGGVSWRLVSEESFHVCAKAKKGGAVFLAGRDGRIAKMQL